MPNLSLLPLAAIASLTLATTALAEGANGPDVAVRDVLQRYRAAIEHLDLKGTEALFNADSQIFESGGSEGTYTNYLAHHLAPELGEFRSFKFDKYHVDVRFIGPVAIATETCSYRIETKKGAIVDRLGVQTSVLAKTGADWRIASMHSSSRKPK